MPSPEHGTDMRGILIVLWVMGAGFLLCLMLMALMSKPG